MADLELKPLTLAEKSGDWPTERIVPCYGTWCCARWNMWLLEGVWQHGWNMIFLPEDSARIWVWEGWLYLDEEGSEQCRNFTDLKSVVTDEGVTMFLGYAYLDNGVIFI